MKEKTQNTNWLSSKEVVKTLKIRSCDVMHMRIEGKLEYMKKGNAFIYTEESVLKNIK